MSRTRLAAGIPVIGLVAALALLGSASASARGQGDAPGARCTFAPDTGALVVVIERDPLDVQGTTSGRLRLTPGPGGILVEGGSLNRTVTCAGGTPTTTNVDAIFIGKDADVKKADIRLVEGGPTARFAPGASIEEYGTPEIEILVDVGSNGGATLYRAWAGADQVDLGGTGGYAAANLNAADPLPDPDLTVIEGYISIRGGKGKDTLRASKGLPGFDSPYPGVGEQIGPALFGEGGKDLLIGSPLRESMIGGGGRDRIKAGSGSDYVVADDGKRDVVNCGPGKADQAALDRVDKRRSCERPIEFERRGLRLLPSRIFG